MLQVLVLGVGAEVSEGLKPREDGEEGLQAEAWWAQVCEAPPHVISTAEANTSCYQKKL